MQKHLLRGTVAAFAVAGLALASSSSSAQSFNSFLPVAVQNGFLLQLNGADITDLSVVGNAGIYRAGFLTSGTPITLEFAGSGSGFGGVNAGDVLTVTRIGAFFLADADDITANRTGNTLNLQDGSTAGFSWVTVETSGGNAGTGYADDTNAFFSDSKKFLAASNSEGTGGTKPRFGEFGFSNISAGGSTNPTYLGFDLGGFVNNGTNFVTGRVRITEVRVPPTAVPEPGIGALLTALLVPASMFYRRRG